MTGSCIMNVWLELAWVDPRLSWNQTQWSNISSVTLSTSGTSSIWVPDVLLYNSGEKTNSRLYNARAVVTSDGSVWWNRPGPMTVEYNSDLSDFPFDKQSLALRLGSWTYDSNTIKLANPRFTTLAFQDHGEWDLRGTSATLSKSYHPCCTTPFDNVIFGIDIKRRPAYYVNQAILPGMILALCAYGTFYMDRMRAVPARTTVLMTSMLSQVTLRVVVSNKVPVQPVSTWLERYQLVLLLFNTVALFEWIWIIWLNSSLFKMRPWEPSAKLHKQTIDLPWPLRSGKRQCALVCDDLLERLALLEEMKEELETKAQLEIAEAEADDPDEAGVYGLKQRVGWHQDERDEPACPEGRTCYELCDLSSQGLARPGGIPPSMELPRRIGVKPPSGDAPAAVSAIKAAAKRSARLAVATESHRSVLDKLEPAMSARSKVIKLIADVQDDIKKRKMAFDLQDAPGPLLALYFDRFFRVAYFVALVVVTAVKFANVDSGDYFSDLASNPGNYI